MPRRNLRFFVVAATVVALSTVVVAQDAIEEFLERYSKAFDAAIQDYDPDRQVVPAAQAILDANDALTSALRDSLSQKYGEVPGRLEAAEGALRDAADIFGKQAENETFQSMSGERFLGDPFFEMRSARPESVAEALELFAEVSENAASRISTLVGSEGDVESLQRILADVSDLRLVLLTYYKVT